MAYFDYWEIDDRNKYSRSSKFKRLIKYITPDWWDYFWYEHHHNDICGSGYHSWKTFKTANLAVVIAIITLITLVLYIILHG